MEQTAPFDPFDGTAAEKAVAEVTFRLADIQQAGFIYAGDGPVTYSVSGTYGGCDLGGGSTLNIDTDRTRLQISPDLKSYNGTGLEINEHYMITVTCGILGPQPPQQGPKNLAWWTTKSQVPWGQNKRKIQDTEADILGRTWKWDLTAR